MTLPGDVQIVFQHPDRVAQSTPEDRARYSSRPLKHTGLQSAMS